MDARVSSRKAYPTSGPSILRGLAAFLCDDQPTRIEERGGVPFFFNAFWAARQRQTHPLHEVSYRACFKPQLPAFFIERLTAPGDLVHDPFMGRGTAPLQAALMGRRAVGSDINPLSLMLARPRLTPPGLGEIQARLSSIDLQGPPPAADDDLLVFFHPQTLAEISALRAYLLRRDAGGRLDPVDDWIRMVAMGRLTGHSPGFFSVYTLPPNQAASVTAQRRINQRLGQVPPLRSAPELIMRKSEALLRRGAPRRGRARLYTAAAECTPGVATASVDLVVTSPPFLDVVNYEADNWMRAWFAGLDDSASQVARHHSLTDWSAFVRRVFVELARVVRPGGHVAFEVGEVRGGSLALETLVLAAIQGLPFQALCVVVNTQAFTKTANCWGVGNNAKGTNSNRIVLAQRV